VRSGFRTTTIQNNNFEARSISARSVASKISFIPGLHVTHHKQTSYMRLAAVAAHPFPLCQHVTLLRTLHIFLGCPRLET